MNADQWNFRGHLGMGDFIPSDFVYPRVSAMLPPVTRDASWKCSYCKGVKPPAMQSCDGCGAPKSLTERGVA